MRFQSQCCPLQPGPAGSAALFGWGELANRCIRGFVLLPVMMTARPQLSHLYLQPLSLVLAQRVPAAQGKMLLPLHFSVLQIMCLCSPILTQQLLLGPAARSMRVRGSHALHFYFSAWWWKPPDNSRARSHWAQLQHVPITGAGTRTVSLCCWGCRECRLQPYSSPFSGPPRTPSCLQGTGVYSSPLSSPITIIHPLWDVQ